MPLKIFLAVTISFLSACQGLPPPKGEGCVARIEAGKEPMNCCFDLSKDFDQNGDPKPEAKCNWRPLTLESFHKHINFDPDSFASLKSYALKIKARCEANQ